MAQYRPSPRTDGKPGLSPQEMFSACPADIAIFGGQAGGGKSFALLMEAARYHTVKGYKAVLFRRTLEDLKKAGGLWDTGSAMYRDLGADIRQGGDRDAQWLKHGAKVQFRGCEYEKNVDDWRGTNLDFVGIDEIHQFTAYQVWGLLSRVRTVTPGIHARLRATCNPEPDSFLRELLDWWIGEDGFADPAKSGVIRYITKGKDDEVINCATREEVQAYIDQIYAHLPPNKRPEPKSLTFIRSTLEDNPYYGRDYLSSLALLDAPTRAKLMDGNWNALTGGGSLFNRSWFNVIACEPDPRDIKIAVRGWDKAGSAVTDRNKDPDWSVGVKMLMLKNGHIVVSDVQRTRQEPGGVDRWMADIVRIDGPRVTQCVWQDPAQAGKVDVDQIKRVMRGACPSCTIDVVVEREKKLVYASHFSAAIDPRTKAGVDEEMKLVASIVAGNYVLPYLAELESFTPTVDRHTKKDQVDASSRAWLYIQSRTRGFAAQFSEAMSRVVF